MNGPVDFTRYRERRAPARPLSLGELMRQLATVTALETVRAHERRHHRPSCLPRRRRLAVQP